jgi:acetyl-CoA carboxylase beta subunit
MTNQWCGVGVGFGVLVGFGKGVGEAVGPGEGVLPGVDVVVGVVDAPPVGDGCGPAVGEEITIVKKAA